MSRALKTIATGIGTSIGKTSNRPALFRISEVSLRASGLSLEHAVPNPEPPIPDQETPMAECPEKEMIALVRQMPQAG